MKNERIINRLSNFFGIVLKFGGNNSALVRNKKSLCDLRQNRPMSYLPDK